MCREKDSYRHYKHIHLYICTHTFTQTGERTDLRDLYKTYIKKGGGGIEKK